MILKRAWAVLLPLIWYTNLYACDVCGCSVNAAYFGILPQYRQHFAGVRYISGNYTSMHIPSLFATGDPVYRESLHRTEIWGRYYPVPRVQVFISIPYQLNQKTEAGRSISNGGISDMSIAANYILVNTGDSMNSDWKNTLSAGMGIKAPTGSFNNNESVTLQTGSGTWDYLFNIIHTIRHRKTGMNTDLNIRINTANSTYRYGNRVTSSIRFFYWKAYKKIQALPNAGLLLEYAANDRKYGISQKYTGGTGSYAAFGTDIYFSRFSAGLSYTMPLYEHLNAGYSRTDQRMSMQLIYLF